MSRSEGGAPRGPAAGRSAPRAGHRRSVVGLIVAAVLASSLALPPVRSGAADAADWLADRWSDWTTELQDVAASVPERQLEEQRRLAGSESLLLTVLDAQGRGAAFAVLSNSDETEPILALIPAALFDILPGYGDFALADANLFEGPDLAALTISNILGIRIDGTLTLDGARLAAALGGPLEVDLPNPLIVDRGDGSGDLIAEEGPALRSAETIAVLMTTEGQSDPLSWLERQAAVWDALTGAMATDAGLVDRIAASASDQRLATGVLAASSAEGPRITVVPVTRITVAGAADAFKIDAGDAATFIDQRMSHLRLTEEARPRLEILNGNGRILTTRAVAEALIRRGYHVVKTDNADRFDYESTVIIAQGRENRAAAERAVSILGVGELLLELRTPSGVVDVSIIVGQDVPAGEGS